MKSVSELQSEVREREGWNILTIKKSCSFILWSKRFGLLLWYRWSTKKQEGNQQTLLYSPHYQRLWKHNTPERLHSCRVRWQAGSLHTGHRCVHLFTPSMWLITSQLLRLQLKYKQSSQSDASSLYHQMPETIETLFAREQTEMLSQVTTQQILHIVFTSRRQTNDEGFLTCLFIITRSNTKKMEEKRWVWIFFLQLCLRLWRHWGSKSSRSCRATYVFISALHVWLVCDCVSGRSETTWTSLMFSLSFRVNTKRTVRRRRPNLCTVNFLKHWRHSTQKRRRSCKVR